MAVLDDPPPESEVQQQGEEEGCRHGPARRLDREVREVAEVLALPLLPHERDGEVHDAAQVELSHSGNLVSKLDLELFDLGPGKGVAPPYDAGGIGADRDHHLVLVAPLPVVLLGDPRFHRLALEDQDEHLCLLGLTQLGVGDAKGSLGVCLGRVAAAQNRYLRVAAHAGVVEQRERRLVSVAHVLEVEHAGGGLYLVLVRVFRDDRLEGLVLLVPRCHVLVPIDAVVGAIELDELPVVPAGRKLLELPGTDVDCDPVVVDDLPDWRVIDDVVQMLCPARNLDRLGGGGATIPVGDRLLFLAVLRVRAGDFLIPPLVVLRDLRDASPVLGVVGLHLLDERFRAQDEEQRDDERKDELPPEGLALEEEEQDGDGSQRHQRCAPDDHWDFSFFG